MPILVYLVFITFLFFFLLAKHFSCMLPVYLGCTLCLLMIFRLLIKIILNMQNFNVVRFYLAAEVGRFLG
jgi:hypothetical protein